MLIRRAAALSSTAISYHLRRFSTAALLQEVDTPLEFTYLDGFPKPDPKYDETIYAIPRAISGKNIAAKERKAGRVPSIVFEAEDGQHGGNKRLISVQTNQIKKLVNHMGTDAVLNVTFIRAPSSAWLKVDVPLVFRGDDIIFRNLAISSGVIFVREASFVLLNQNISSFFMHILSGKEWIDAGFELWELLSISVPDIIPPFIDVDLSELDVGQKIVAGNLNVHPALKLLRPKDEAVVKIMGARVSDQRKSK
ncbi:hypothetical protein DH2020_005603 [Rehmannia glutinosa]|uniref:Ribosomal protein L25 beta domain-containing protein n=1 Tax=Rehmannia glutinosa TaxID=99300 RepID=A0ABR0XGR0_REHGL